MEEANGMDLLLWRHAEAEDGFPDAGRPLTARGIKQATKMAQWLREFAPKDLRILVSPARRTVQTANAFSEHYELTEEIGTGSDPQRVIAATGWPNAGRAVLVVGHQPTIGSVASLLMTGVDDGLSFKKGALWWFVLREREGEFDTVLKAVVQPSLLP